MCMYLHESVYADICVFIWMSHAFVYLRVCVCVCQIAGWGQRAKQTQQNKYQNKTTNGIIMADILKNKHKLYRDSILFW